MAMALEFKVLALKTLAVSALTAVFTVAGPALAVQDDVDGSADHPMVGRYEGSVIKSHQIQEYAEEFFPSQAFGNDGDDNPAAYSVAIAGKVTRIHYEGPQNRSALEVVRNYQSALEGNDFETVFFCVNKDCGEDAEFWEIARGGVGLFPAWESNTYGLFKLARAEGDIYVAVFALDYSNPARAEIVVRVGELRPVELDKVSVYSADTIAQKLNSQGRIALYAIEFDHDSDVIKASSDEQIAEIAAFLTTNANINVLVVGHSDMTGGLDYNQSLSERRAKAVVERLSSDSGIARDRLAGIGVGPASPVASNRSEDGRARNRRVEIVDRGVD